MGRTYVGHLGITELQSAGLRRRQIGGIRDLRMDTPRYDNPSQNSPKNSHEARNQNVKWGFARHLELTAPNSVELFVKADTAKPLKPIRRRTATSTRLLRAGLPPSSMPRKHTSCTSQIWAKWRNMPGFGSRSFYKKSCASDFDSSLLVAGIKQLDCGSVDFPFTKYVAYFPICNMTNFAIEYMQTLSLEHLKASAIRWKLSSSIRPKIATDLTTGLSLS